MQITVNQVDYKVITTNDDPSNFLRTKCLSIAPWELEDYAKLLVWLYNFVGSKKIISGIALPQIWICKAGFVMNGKDKTGKKYGAIVINPEILSFSWPITYEVEGCLSELWVQKKVMRHYSIRVKYQDQTGDERIKTFTGYTARVFQHEYDHLIGVLLTDKE